MEWNALLGPCPCPRFLPSFFILASSPGSSMRENGRNGIEWNWLCFFLPCLPSSLPAPSPNMMWVLSGRALNGRCVCSFLPCLLNTAQCRYCNSERNGMRCWASVPVLASFLRSTQRSDGFWLTRDSFESVSPSDALALRIASVRQSTSFKLGLPLGGACCTLSSE